MITRAKWRGKRRRIRDEAVMYERWRAGCRGEVKDFVQLFTFSLLGCSGG